MGTCFSKDPESSNDPPDNNDDADSSSDHKVSSIQMRKKKKKMFSFKGKRRNVKHDAAYFTYKV